DCDTSISGDYIIPDTIEGYPVTAIGNLAFYDCELLTDIFIPGSVKIIGDYAFYYCSSLKNIEISTGVIEIGDGAFCTNEALVEIEIPSSVQIIGNEVFSFCTSLERITVSDDNEYFSSDSYGVLYNKDKTELVVYPCSGATEYTIPDSVTSIKKYAFKYCENLEKIEIPESVTSIGSQAFCRCENLKSVEISANVTFIGSGAFLNCYSLEGIFVSDDNKYYTSDSHGVLFDKSQHVLFQFPNGNNITEYAIPDGVTNIYDSAFYECSSLDKISIPESVINIGYGAFHHTGYDNDSSNWEDGVLYIDDCLIDARNLTTETYEVKDGTRLIAQKAFTSPATAENIILPDSVKIINSSAFLYQTSLVNITIPSSVISIYYSAFSKTNKNLTIHGECGSRAYYYAKSYSINFEATDHPDTEVRNAVESTCTEDGYTGDICCYYCGEILEYGTVIPSANGHTFTDWETVKEPTYLEQGETSRYCTVCGYTETEAIDCIIPDASASDGDVEIDYTEGTFDSDVTVKADKVQDENKYLLITDHFRNNGKNARAEIYDISTYVYNQKVQPNGSVLVRIPIPQGYNREKICVVYITDSGEIQNVPCRCADGYVYFEASHFSMYAIVEATEDETDDDSSSVSSFVQFICKFVRLLCKLFGKEAYYDALEQSIVKILGAIF
ncbi:MAG: leucine-rich repeat domain-containing protein, partial [Clostridiales bacterium]|nr:leucine-rich repeat domain-containing protein [Clostridiales bacterium]